MRSDRHAPNDVSTHATSPARPPPGALAVVGLLALTLLAACTCRRANAPAEREAHRATARGAVPDEAPAQSGSVPGAPPRAAPAEGQGAAVLRRSVQCGSAPLNGDVRWLGTDEAYRAALDAIDRGALPGTAPSPAPVDFTTHGVLLVLMGQRPTAGYTLELASELVPVEDGTGTVRVNWSEPPENAMVAQVVTSPCLLVAVRKEGLRAVKVVDQAGRARETLQLQ